jgi:methylmalonyl-CoA/ethylmalonyl-CoA epimerase
MSGKAQQSPGPAADLKLHHVGFVVSSIQDCAQSFALALGATWDGNIVFDPLQKVRVTFFEGRSAADPLIELVEPGGPESPVSRFLERGGGLHHLCYEVVDLEGHLEFCKSSGSLILRQPVPAVAFDGRRIAWAMTRKKLLLEFLESSL